MSLAVEVTCRRGGFELAAKFESSSGVTAVFGPSGAGKSTLLDLVAGLERPATGRIALDGEVLVDTATRAWVAPHRRRLGYVFQNGRLFPHLSVRENLRYGQRFARVRTRAADEARVVEMLGIGGLLDRRPATLSGGEKQRVAIGRALLSAPRLLLLDEPMASLDAARQSEILPWLERLRDEAAVPIVYVSHSLSEVARLADNVVLLEHGRVTAVGPVQALLARLDLPETQGAEAGAVLTARGGVRRHSGTTLTPGTVPSGDSPLPRARGGVRRLSGTTLTPGTVPAGDSPLARAASDPSGSTELVHAAGVLHVPWSGIEPGATVRLHVLARDVALAIGPIGSISIRNRLAATIVEISEPRHGVVQVRLDVGGETLLARITSEAVQEMGLAPGMPVTALVKSVALER